MRVPLVAGNWKMHKTLPEALELVLPGGRRIMVRPGFDRPTLLALVDALGHGTADDARQESGA